MKRFIFFILLFISVLGNLFAQAPDTLWLKIHEITNDIDEGKCIRQTIDGGYIITGSYAPDGLESHVDVLLVKTDAVGNILWTKAYDWNFFEEGLSVEQTLDGGYIIGGRCTTGSFPFTNPPISDAWILKTDSNGDTLWTKTYGGSGNDYCTSIQQTPDTGYIMTGTMNSGYCYPNYEICEDYQPTPSCAWLIKTDSDGDTLWTKTYHERSHGTCVDQTIDGGYIIVGWIFPDEQDNQSDVLLIKTNASGDTLWTKIFGGNDYDAGFCVRQVTDGYVIAGQTKPKDRHYSALLIKTDLSGEILWSKTLSGELSNVAFSVDVSDDGYFITGSTNGTWWVTGLSDMWAFETDFDGNLLWERSYDIRSTDIFHNGIKSADGGYIVTGMTAFPWVGSGALLISKLGQEPTGITVKDNQSNISDYVLFQNYPNPFNAETRITFELKRTAPITLKIYDLLGNEIPTVFQNVLFQAGIHSVGINAEPLASGVYFYRLELDGNYIQMKKMCVLK